MAPPDEERLIAFIAWLRARGLTVVIVDHNFRLIERVADTVTVLAAGAVVATGAPTDVARDPRVRDVYLGELEQPA